MLKLLIPQEKHSRINLRIFFFTFHFNKTQTYIQCHLPQDFSAGDATFYLTFKDLVISTPIKVVDREGKAGSSQIYRKSLTPERNEKLLEKRRQKNVDRKNQKQSENSPVASANQLMVGLNIQDNSSISAHIQHDTNLTGKKRKLTESYLLIRKKARTASLDRRTVDTTVDSIVKNINPIHPKELNLSGSGEGNSPSSPDS